MKMGDVWNVCHRKSFPPGTCFSIFKLQNTVSYINHKACDASPVCSPKKLCKSNHETRAENDQERFHFN